jgi:ribosome-binding factor A
MSALSLRAASFVGVIMKRKHASFEELLSSCDRVGPGDGADPRFDFRLTGRRTGRKALQLCDQVARTLAQVLTWESGDEFLREVQVEGVVPAPNAGRLLAIVSIPSDRQVGEVLERLARCAGRLRAEVAAAIHRRRAPELAFEVIRRRE